MQPPGPEGTQQPYGAHPGQLENPNQIKPEMGPPPGAERTGPKPGMVFKPPVGEANIPAPMDAGPVGPPEDITGAGPPMPMGDHALGGEPAPGPDEGAVLKLIEGLNQWLDKQGEPGGETPTPTPGSSTQQESKDSPDFTENFEKLDSNDESDPSMEESAPEDDSSEETKGEFPEKQTGSNSPLTNAGTQKTPIEETAQKSIFTKFGW